MPLSTRVSRKNQRRHCGMIAFFIFYSTFEPEYSKQVPKIRDLTPSQPRASAAAGAFTNFLHHQQVGGQVLLTGERCTLAYTAQRRQQQTRLRYMSPTFGRVGAIRVYFVGRVRREILTATASSDSPTPSLSLKCGKEFKTLRTQRESATPIFCRDKTF